MTDQPANRDANSPPARLLSLDAYRGFVMLLMASDGLRLVEVARRFPDSPTWQAIGYQFDHVPWVGCAFWDLIQPSFMFLVGVAMAYSCASRQARGQSYGRMLAHAVFRSVVLVFLGIFLRSRHADHVVFTFEDVLTQIGLGYTFLFLLWNRGAKVQLAVAAAILAAHWCWFYFYPLPPAGFDSTTVGVPADWPRLEGTAAHWEKNTNPAADFDVWFLNLFPRPKPFQYNAGGYLTLSFIPSLVTMILGLVGGELLRSGLSGARKFAILVAAGVVLLAAGQIMHSLGICPIVKRIWTPSWTLFAAGWTSLILAAFYGIVDLANWRRWTYPLVVVGANSIAMYCMAELLPGWIEGRLRALFGQDVFSRFGAFEPLAIAGAILLIMWLVCWWLYRKRIFIRI